MEFKAVVVFLLTTQTVFCTAELTGDNICPILIKETVSLRVKVKEPVTIKAYTWCFRIPPRCSKYRVEMRERFKIQHEPRTRTVASCCPGYAPDKDNKLCVAVCSGGCQHGHCDLPEKCSCEPGYAGQQCDTECGAGFFGASCAQQCSCDNGAVCHHVTGDCNCTAGWRGTRCDVPCAPGSYGDGCSMKCHCETSILCHHVTGDCDVVSTTPTEEATSQATTYHFAGGDGETSGMPFALPGQLRETSEVPLSTLPDDFGNRVLDRLKLLTVTEDYLTTRGIKFTQYDNATVTATASSQSNEPSTPDLSNSSVPIVVEDFEKDIHLFGSKIPVSNISIQLENIERTTEKSSDSTEHSGGYGTEQYPKSFLPEDVSYNENKSSTESDISNDLMHERENRVNVEKKKINLSEDDNAGFLPDPSNDLQHLKQVKPTRAEPEDVQEGVIGGDLLSTSCASAAVAIALILTATLIVAVAHWRKANRKNMDLRVSEPAATAVFTYNGVLSESMFPEHKVESSQTSVVSLDSGLPEENHKSGMTDTLQRETKLSSDLRDSMTSHYDIPPPARLSAQGDGKGSAGEPIYEEIPGWTARGNSSFLSFGAVLETSRV